MTFTPTEALLTIVALLAISPAITLWIRSRRQRQAQPSSYGRATYETRSKSKTEAMLAARQGRVSGYNIRRLSAETRDDFIETWRAVQAQFVSDPRHALTHADDLLGEVMLARGFPLYDFAERAADLSVEHPHIVQYYRTGHDIAVRHPSRPVSTQELRTAMTHFRVLFDDLVNEPADLPRQTAIPGSRI